MKVLFVLDALGEGGTERSTADLLVPLRDLGVDSELAILRSRGTEGVELAVRERGFAVHILPTRAISRQVGALRRLIREGDVDLVHSALYASNLRARAVRLTDRTPLLNSVVNVSYGDGRLANPRITPRKLEAVRRFDALTARVVDHFHAVSAPVRDHVIETLRLPPERVTVVERGRDRRLFGLPSGERRRAARDALGIDEGTEVLLSLARHEHQKGLDTLMAAADELRDRPDLVVLQAGRDGDASEEVRAQHQALALGNRVRFLGHCSDVADLLCAADILVAPTRHEGMPGVLLEAMAMGLPIVSTTIPTVAEVVEDGVNGLLVPVDEPAELAKACARLLDDVDESRRMSEANRQAFETRFTIEASAAGLAELYRSILARPGRGPLRRRVA
jgi:glycosyltransferase involved in cell wall biosynthesis